ncbi:hypothetical protein [Kitasatospora cathayae]|uniref:hypothetical protein n=1 Tax=Kitasatospora cathayae TaxID=3004092 RepID=UPI002FD84D4E
MGDVGGEALLVLEAAVQGAGHQVDGGGEVGDLVLAVDEFADPGVGAAGRDAPGGGGRARRSRLTGADRAGRLGGGGGGAGHARGRAGRRRVGGRVGGGGGLRGSVGPGLPAGDDGRQRGAGHGADRQHPTGGRTVGTAPAHAVVLLRDSGEHVSGETAALANAPGPYGRSVRRQ